MVGTGRKAARQGVIAAAVVAAPAEETLTLARALRDALRQASPEAFIQGDPEDGRLTVVDGRFDLRTVANLLAEVLSKPKLS